MGESKKIVVIGTGMMGNGIAAVAALAGHNAVLVGTSPEKATLGVEKAKACIDELIANELADPSIGEAAKPKLSMSPTLDEAVQGADIVIEAIYENMSLKQELFARLDELLPADVPLLSNTSSLPITMIASKVKRFPERTMTAHFWLPAHLIPLVEIVMWEKTDEAMALEVKEELAAWGKAPVLVRRDLPGQLGNRIQHAMIREAVNIVATGLASPEDVDTCLQMGMGVRLAAWGLMTHIDAVGLDLNLTIQETVLPDLNKDTDNQYLKALVEAGNLGYKSGKGIYDWSKKDMAALVEKRNDYIIHALKMVRPK